MRHIQSSSMVTSSYVIALAAPARVSPAPAAEQKQHQKNNQHGFHVVPHLQEEAGLAFVTVVHFFTNMIEVATTDVWSHLTTLSARFVRRAMQECERIAL
jgi:hypothetical protein